MASNLTGMFQQMNQALSANPMAQGGMGDQLLSGGMMNLGRAAGQATGTDPTSWMSSKVQEAHQLQKKTEAENAISKLDLSTTEGKKQAAQLYNEAGMVDQALAMGRAAEEQQRVENAKNNAILDVQNEEVQAQLKRKQDMQQKRYVTKLAAQKKNPEIADAVRNGVMSPEAAMQAIMAEEELYELSSGEMLTDKDGNIIRLNPHNTGPGTAHASDKKKWDELNALHYEAAHRANNYSSLIQQIESEEDWSAGFFATAEGWALEQLGKRDKPQYLRTEAIRLINSEAINNLPPGTASDKDVEIAREGYPRGKSAGKEEVLRYLKAVERLSRVEAEYNEMLKDHVIRQDRESFDQNWKTHMMRKDHQQKLQAVPDAAIRHLQANPQLAQDPAERDAFIREFGVAPEEFLKNGN